jgi:hypothetical protein
LENETKSKCWSVDLVRGIVRSKCDLLIGSKRINRIFGLSLSAAVSSSGDCVVCSMIRVLHLLKPFSIDFTHTASDMAEFSLSIHTSNPSGGLSRSFMDNFPFVG